MFLLALKPDCLYACDVALFTRRDDKGNNCIVVSGVRHARALPDNIPEYVRPRVEAFLEIISMFNGYYRNPEILVHGYGENEIRMCKNPTEEQLAGIEWEQHYVDTITPRQIGIRMPDGYSFIAFTFDPMASKNIELIQRWWRERLARKRERRLTICMGMHPRLGADSIVRQLNKDVFKQIVLYVW